ncbi:MAG: lipopolysaccharide biosynthesis protein [Bacteroidota bacterium]|nr:lipopolysaccharide biosynthesis protein [Bacteroidota bacterium]
MGDDLKQKMLSAMTWSTVDRFGQQAVQFVIGLILARLLTPDDYGLIGMVMVFVSLSTALVDGGFGQALIRKQNADETDYNTVFYFNIVISLFLYIILFFLAPFIAIFFNQPQLINISRVIFIAILFNALYLIPVAKMVRNLDYKNGAKINIFSVTCSGIAGVTMAFNGFGVWSLVAQQVLFHFFRMICLHYFVKWKPRAIFSIKVIRNFWSFSINLLGTYILNMIFNYLYILILGKFYPKHEVGYYTQANKLNETTNTSFQSILVGSTYSLLVKIQYDDERFRRIFREIARKISIITFPIMLVLIIVAHPLIYVLLTEKWIAAVPYFQLLCFASLFAPLYGLNISALNSRGKSKITFKLEIIKKALILLSVVICFHFGIIAMLIGYVFSCFIAYIISVLYLKNDLNHYIKNQISDFIGCIGIGIFIAACDFGLSFLIHNNHVLLGTQIVTSGILYILSMKLFYSELYNQVLEVISGKLALLKKKMI